MGIWVDFFTASLQDVAAGKADEAVAEETFGEVVRAKHVDDVVLFHLHEALTRRDGPSPDDAWARWHDAVAPIVRTALDGEVTIQQAPAAMVAALAALAPSGLDAVLDRCASEPELAELDPDDLDDLLGALAALARRAGDRPVFARYSTFRPPVGHATPDEHLKALGLLPRQRSSYEEWMHFLTKKAAAASAPADEESLRRARADVEAAMAVRIDGPAPAPRAAPAADLGGSAGDEESLRRARADVEAALARLAPAGQPSPALPAASSPPTPAPAPSRAPAPPPAPGMSAADEESLRQARADVRLAFSRLEHAETSQTGPLPRRSWWKFWE